MSTRLSSLTSSVRKRPTFKSQCSFIFCCLAVETAIVNHFQYEWVGLGYVLSLAKTERIKQFKSRSKCILNAYNLLNDLIKKG